MSVVGNKITLYQFSPFYLEFQASGPVSFASSSPELLPYCSIDPSINTRLIFNSTSGIPVSYPSLLSLVLTVNGQRFSQYDVSVLPGRWTLSSPSPFTFYQGEALTPVFFDSDVDISAVFSQPTLPPGLRVEQETARRYRLVGTPLLTSTATSFLIVGRTPAGRLISITIVINVAPERLVVNGGPIVVSGMIVDQPITPRVLTASVPSTATTPLRYTAVSTTLPSGLFFTDATGNPVSLPFQPTDAYRTLRIEGIPTIATAREFRSRAGVSRQYTWSLVVRASVGSLVHDVDCSFTFGPTVLFDEASESFAPSLFQGVPVASVPPFRAFRYFQDVNVGITDLSDNTTLPPGLSLTPFTVGTRTLTGTPLTFGTTITTMTAIDSSGNRGSMTLPLTISSNVITITPSNLGGGSTFIQSRSLLNGLSNYYSAPISFTGVSAAGCNVTYSMTGLEGTDIVLTGNVLTGTPINPAASRTVRITASDTFTSSSFTFSASVLADTFSFTPNSLSIVGIQNTPLSPARVFATTLSERPILRYSLVNAPVGVTISTTGQVEGTPIAAGSGTFSIIASTGFATGSLLVNYTIEADTVLVQSPVRNVGVELGAPFTPIHLIANTYSGRPIVSYDLSYTSSTFYGLSVGATTGVISGQFASGFPDIFPSYDSCYFRAFAGNVMGDIKVEMNVQNPYKKGSFIAYRNSNAVSVGTFGGNLFTSLLSEPLEFQENVRSYSVSTRSDPLDNISYFLTTQRTLQYKDGPLFQDRGQLPEATLGFTRYGNTLWIVKRGELWKSDNEGATWNYVNSIPSIQQRFRPTAPNSFTHAYKDNAVTLVVQSNVILIGGQTMLRSADGGMTWSVPTNGFEVETGGISTDVSGCWVAVGSDLYPTSCDPAFPPDTEYNTSTIKFSIDQGNTWTDVTSGFNRIGQCIAYGGGKWVATGISMDLEGRRVYETRYSQTGSNGWTVAQQIDVSSSSYDPFYEQGTIPFKLGPVFVKDASFNVMALHVDSVLSGLQIYKTVQYENTNSTLTDWVISSPNEYKDVFGTSPNADELEVVYKAVGQQTVLSGTPANVVTLTFDTITPGGPTLSFPTDLTFTQYVPIQDVVISVTSETLPIYLFVDPTDVPDGFTFNVITNTLSGTPLHQGTFSIPILAKDNNGISEGTLSFRVVPPSYTKRYDGAGAFTSMVRHYTPVNAAQNARDNRVLNTEEQGLGAFLAPAPPDITSAPPPCDC